MPHFGASLTDDARVVIYNRNVFIIQATENLYNPRMSMLNKLECFVSKQHFSA
jgi:hypothetical protein